ncbi:MAG: TrkH family potassium uptake protein, partial [Lachnospiraceae bacterium]|nr:TrkH family potassium uptake protein [Lachnospiraceae bacterium]
MNYRMMGKFIGRILFVEVIFMLPALLISVYHGEKDTIFGFLTGMVISLLAALFLTILCRKARKGFYAREGLVCVGASWIVMSLLGCLPFYFSGEIPHFIDAVFETVSGFTTTGASILPEVESLSRGNLYWRSFNHWLGGMGVGVFVVGLGRGGGRSDGDK